MSAHDDLGAQVTEHGITVTELVARIRERQTQWHNGDMSGYDWSAWGDVARELLTDPTVTPTSLARASGIARATAHQRLRRHPPRA